jgi:hypothetical protein
LAFAVQKLPSSRAGSNRWRSQQSGWTWGCISTINSNGQTIFVADAHRDDERWFIVHVDEKFSAFLELQRAVCIHLLNLATESTQD